MKSSQSLFLITLTVLSGTDPLFCRKSFSWNLLDVFLMIGPGLWTWGRKITKIKWTHHIIFTTWLHHIHIDVDLDDLAQITFCLSGSCPVKLLSTSPPTFQNILFRRKSACPATGSYFLSTYQSKGRISNSCCFSPTSYSGARILPFCWHLLGLCRLNPASVKKKRMWRRMFAFKSLGLKMAHITST